MPAKNTDTPITLSLEQIAKWQNTVEATSQSIDQETSNIIAKVPSLQRGAVWKPGQVELLWDSILRGFPIGAFVVCKKLESQHSRKGQNDKSKDNIDPTHHLLDGQQRANAIALGFDDPFFSVRVLKVYRASRASIKLIIAI